MKEKYNYVLKKNKKNSLLQNTLIDDIVKRRAPLIN